MNLSEEVYGPQVTEEEFYQQGGVPVQEAEEVLHPQYVLPVENEYGLVTYPQVIPVQEAKEKPPPKYVVPVEDECGRVSYPEVTPVFKPEEVLCLQGPVYPSREAEEVNPPQYVVPLADEYGRLSYPEVTPVFPPEDVPDPQIPVFTSEKVLRLQGPVNSSEEATHPQGLGSMQILQQALPSVGNLLQSFSLAGLAV